MKLEFDSIEERNAYLDIFYPHRRPCNQGHHQGRMVSRDGKTLIDLGSSGQTITVSNVAKRG